MNIIVNFSNRETKRCSLNIKTIRLVRICFNFYIYEQRISMDLFFSPSNQYDLYRKRNFNLSRKILRWTNIILLVTEHNRTCQDIKWKNRVTGRQNLRYCLVTEFPGRFPMDWDPMFTVRVEYSPLDFSLCLSFLPLLKRLKVHHLCHLISSVH